MSGSEPRPAQGAGKAEAADEGGVLGNLPRSRPSVRSPRRADPRPDPPRAEAEADDPATAPAGREGELEALARAGLSLAGGAATLGLRAAGRAAAALRDAVERR